MAAHAAVDSPDAEEYPRLSGPGPVRAAVIGYGYWGPNLARNIAANEAMELAAIVEPRLGRLAAAARAHPSAAACQDAQPVLDDPGIDLVVVATPPATHFQLARVSIEAGKHVLLEKPFVTSEADALELIDLAARTGRHLFVDHTFLFTGAVRRLRELTPEIGGLRYFDATRTNLGTVQADSDVLWDLAPHDLSVLLSLFDEPIELVAAMGAQHAPACGPTMAYVTLRFASGALAHFHLNWMAPAKVRRTIIGGSRKMLVYDDIEPHEKVKVFSTGDAGEPTAPGDLRERMVDYRVGDVFSPHVDPTEALATEMAHIVRVLREDERPISDGAFGLRVVRVIEAAQRSLAVGGVPVHVSL